MWARFKYRTWFSLWAALLALALSCSTDPASVSDSVEGAPADAFAGESPGDTPGLASTDVPGATGQPTDGAPELTFVTPDDEAVYRPGTEVVVVVQVSDDHRVTAEVVFRDGAGAPVGVAALDSTGRGKLTLPGLPPGAHSLVATATDSVGHVVEATLHLEVDEAPSAPVLAISPEHPTTAADLVATVLASAIDPEAPDIPPLLVWSWRRDGQDAGVYGESVASAMTARGQVWQVTAVPADRYGPGPAGSATVTIENALPSAAAVHVSPDPADLWSTLECVTEPATDDDGDMLAYEVSWSVNGTVMEGATSTSVSAAALAGPGGAPIAAGDLVACHVVASDGLGEGLASSSAAVTLGGVDICASDQNPCDVSATCENTKTLTPVCACLAGFFGDGLTCTDVDECLTDNGGCGPVPYFACANQVGGPPACSDVDECQTDNGGCGPVPYFACANQVGGPPACSDVDECQTDNGGCGPVPFFACANQVGALPVCDDVDECLTDNGGCGPVPFFMCQNQVGKTPLCADVDECKASNGGCGPVPFFTCQNQVGKAPLCADVDECKTSNGGCGSATYTTCKNQVGKAPTCTDIDECKTSNGGCGSATYMTCKNQVGKKPTCTDIDECKTNNGGCGSTAAFKCTNNVGKKATCTAIPATYHLPWKCNVTKTCTAGNGQFHHAGNSYYAFDFSMSSGTAILAMRGGKVTAAHKSTGPGEACYNGCSGGSGFTACCNACIAKANWVNVQHPDGTIGHYGHFSKVSVSVGQTVKQGAQLGLAGTTGCSTGPHLHTGVMKGCPTGICKMIKFTFQEAGSPKSGKAVKSTNCP